MDLEHEKRLVECEQRSKSNTRRLDEMRPIVDEIHKMGELLVEITTEMRHTNKDLREIKDKVETLEERPAKKWDTLSTVIVTALTSAIVTYIFTLITTGGM